MNNVKMTYFEKADVLHLSLTDEPEANSIEIAPNITAELNEVGEIIGIEILRASTFIRDAVLASVPGKLLNLVPSEALRT